MPKTYKVPISHITVDSTNQVELKLAFDIDLKDDEYEKLANQFFLFLYNYTPAPFYKSLLKRMNYRNERD